MKLFNVTAAFLFVVALTVSVNAGEFNTSSQKEVKTAGLFQNDNFYRGAQYNSYQSRYTPSRNRTVGYQNSAYGRTSNCANGQCGLNGSCASGNCGHTGCVNGQCGLTASCANGTCGHLNKNCADGSCYKNSSYNTNYNTNNNTRRGYNTRGVNYRNTRTNRSTRTNNYRNARTNNYRNTRTNSNTRNTSFLGVRLQSPILFQQSRNTYSRGY